MLAKGVTPILNVSDIAESFLWFEKLGWTKGWEWGQPPTFGGVCSGQCDGHVFRISRGTERAHETQDSGPPEA